MTWLGIVLWVMMHAGDIINIVHQIIELIRHLPKGEQLKAREAFTAAIQSKNADNVRMVAKEWRMRCEPGLVGCPIDLVK